MVAVRRRDPCNLCAIIDFFEIFFNYFLARKSLAELIGAIVRCHRQHNPKGAAFTDNTVDFNCSIKGF